MTSWYRLQYGNSRFELSKLESLIGNHQNRQLARDGKRRKAGSGHIKDTRRVPGLGETRPIRAFCKTCLNRGIYWQRAGIIFFDGPELQFPRVLPSPNRPPPHGRCWRLHRIWHPQPPTLIRLSSSSAGCIRFRHLPDPWSRQRRWISNPTPYYLHNLTSPQKET